jgi:DNA invertase Pin-like site-specific DNA recombinase
LTIGKNDGKIKVSNYISNFVRVDRKEEKEMGNFFCYKRISTKEERGLQKYNRQNAALKRYAEENEIEYVAEFAEDVSGKDFEHRKEWQRLEKLLQTGDTVVFKDISRFTREAEEGYKKYMDLLNKGIDLIFIDNNTVSTPYINQLLNVAQQQNLIAKTSLESTVKLLLYVELDRAEQERKILINRIKNGIAASGKKQGRKVGTLDKLTDELKADIEAYLTDRTIKQSDLMAKHGISRNTLKKYAEIVKKQN